MRKINNLVNKILSESLTKKASEITEKIKNKLKYNEFDYVAETEMNEKWKGDVEVEKTGEYSDMSISEINSEIKKLKSKTEKYKEEGKKVPTSMKEKMSELYFAKRAKQGWKGKGKAVVDEEEMEEGNAFTGALAKAKEMGKDTFEVGGKEFKVQKESIVYQVEIDGELINLSENEMVDMIEDIVLEEKIKSNIRGTGKAKGTVEYDRVHKKDEDINEKAINDVAKKMEEYVKPGSKAKFDMNPKTFPKGNGELGEMSKKAYQASDAVEEYITNFAYAPGMENLKTDEIDYNDEWVTKNIEGSELTGNSPKYANAVDTGFGKKINKKRKENWYQKELDQSYNRVTQPVDNAGDSKKDGKLKNMFKKLKESENEETENILNEEMVKMKHLLTYNKKTQ